MKNIFKSLMIVAVAAMTFTACTQENNEVNAVKKGTTLTITADLAADDTRVAFGEADANGVRKTLWEAGDKVSFVVYRDDAIYTFVNDLEVAEAGATANFTVEFQETLQTGDRIEAFVGKKVAGSDGWYWFDTYEYDQNPTDDGLSTVYVKAVAEYDGNDVVSLTFKHQYPYGKMTTDFAVKFEEVRFEFAGMDKDDYESAIYVTIYPNNISGNDYWFYTESELFDITEITINAKDADNKSYKFTKEIDASVGFKFVVGEISSFTVNDFVVGLVAPEVEAVADATSVKLTWDAVEGAKDYTVTFNGEDTVVTVCEFTATDLNALTNYSFNVAPNPDDSGKYYQDYSSSSYVSVTTLPDESVVADFSYVYDVKEVREGYTYAYKFSNSTNAEEYIYLQFEEDVFSLPEGTYTYATNDGLVYGGVSAFNIPEYANGSYKEHWMQDSNLVIVEVAEYITITAYCTRSISGYNGNATYKGVWSNKPAEPAESDGIVFTSSLLEAPYGFGDLYIILSDDSGLEVCLNFYNCQQADKNFLPVGTYNVQTEEGGIYPGDDFTYAVKGSETYVINEGTVVVSEVDGAYKFEIDLVAATLGAIKGTYEGAIEGMVVPSEWKEPEPEEITFTSASAVQRETSWWTVTFTDDANTLSLGVGNQGVNYWNPGTWSSDYYYSSGYSLDNPTFNSELCYPISAEVSVVDGKYNVVLSWTGYTAKFNGQIEGFVLPGVEPETPGDGGDATGEDGLSPQTAFTYTNCTTNLDSYGAIVFNFSGASDGSTLKLNSNSYAFSALEGVTSIATNKWYNPDCVYSNAEVDWGMSYVSLDTVDGDNSCKINYIMLNVNGANIYYKYDGVIEKNW